MKKNTITQCLFKARERPRSWTALRYFQNGSWHSKRWSEVYQICESLAGFLMHFGIGKKERVAIISNTRPEWLYCDFAIMGIGAVTVPIYQSQRIEEIIYILNNSEAKIVFVEDQNQYLKWTQMASQCPHVLNVVMMSKGTWSEPPENLISWESCLALGRQFMQDQPQSFENSISGQNLEDWASLIYTSGTTGNPKGVVLTHLQIMSEMESIADVIHLNEKDISLSFLPYAHVLGRVESWASVYCGFTLAFAESIERLRVNLVDIRPTFLMAVPRIFEKLYGSIFTQMQSQPFKQKIFKWALPIGKQVFLYRSEKKTIPLHLLASYQLAEKLVFQSILNKFGGRLRFVVSGGAPLSVEIADFFYSVGLPIYEGYGLTETTAAIAVNTPLAYKLGTVGKPFKEVEIKIADDGEILVRSEKVMDRYYDLPKDTTRVFSEGYFHTGDIGYLDQEGFLKITDRKKDLIKTSGGKYVAPQKLEGLLKLNPFISNALIYGDQQKYIVALITLQQKELLDFARKEGLSYQDPGMLTQNPRVKGYVQSLVTQVNRQLANYESIKNFSILPRDFSVDAGELTPSLKVKRKFCSEKFRSLLQQLY
ncbi:MAG: long-chain fatty acid--CoA ligase [Bdellovibrionales bacterium]|nr:long-chain fatty acid--CoA ligase [Bdellovibrionales bacterium]